MKCKCGKYPIRYFLGGVCPICKLPIEDVKKHDFRVNNDWNLSAVSTVSFKQNRNVPVNRIKMIKRRKLARDGKGEVILMNHAGKETSRRASDY